MNTLREAIEQVDQSADSAPMINCAHPVQEPGMKQCGAFEPNVSCKSREDLKAMETFDMAMRWSKVRILVYYSPNCRIAMCWVVAAKSCLRLHETVMGVVPLGQPLGNF
jgi:hypothetical protein